MPNIPDGDLRASGAQIPLRRVVMVDPVTGSPATMGGGGSTTIDTAPLAKSAKQDETIAALGAPADAAASSDTGTFSIIALLKRWFSKLPASLGAKTSAASLSVVPASDANFQTILRTSTTGGLLTARIISAASTNATVIKGSAAMVYGYEFHNKSANTLMVRFYNKATAPVPGTDTPVRQSRIPPGGMAATNRAHGLPFSAGLGIDIVTEAGAAVAANDVMGSVDYV